ncbi:MAG: hypothetical protein IIV56_03355 [Mailhella sp.]|nr:hypothetical protein [Mailhella sp.]
MDILIVTPRAAFWEGKKGVFEKYGAALRMVPAMPEALDSLKEKKAALALLDLFGGEAWNSEIHASAMKKAVISILMQDAMTNTASVCGMGEETFHDAMEGLGMINDLPAQPSEADVEDLMSRLRVILGQA